MDEREERKRERRAKLICINIYLIYRGIIIVVGSRNEETGSFPLYLYSDKKKEKKRENERERGRWYYL